MPLDTSYLKSEMMHAEIRLANPESYMRLLHAFEAIHNSFSHDSDLITFLNDDDLLQFMRRDYAGLEAYPWMSDELGDELSNGTSDES